MSSPAGGAVGDDARRAAAASEEVVVVTDADGLVVAASPTALQLYRHADRGLAGAHVSVIAAADSGGKLADQLRAVLRGETVQEDDARRVLRGQTVVEVGSRLTPLRDQAGRVVGAWIVDHDTGEPGSLVATLQRRVADQQQKLDEARASGPRGSTLLADAARQLRAPVGGIHAGVKGLLRGPTPDEYEQLLADVRRQAARGAHLVNSLLRLAPLEDGESLQPAPCDLARVCVEAADRARRHAPHLHIEVEAEELPNDPAHLDEQAVRELIAQLLDNACRHAASRIDVVIATGDGLVELRVSDDGSGIPAGMAERAFERFSSFDEMGGAGLGLPLARELARAHGGELAYEDGVFVVRLPAGSPSPPG